MLRLGERVLELFDLALQPAGFEPLVPERILRMCESARQLSYKSRMARLLRMWPGAGSYGIDKMKRSANGSSAIVSRGYKV